MLRPFDKTVLVVNDNLVVQPSVASGEHDMLCIVLPSQLYRGACQAIKLLALYLHFSIPICPAWCFSSMFEGIFFLGWNYYMSSFEYHAINNGQFFSVRPENVSALLDVVVYPAVHNVLIRNCITYQLMYVDWFLFVTEIEETTPSTKVSTSLSVVEFWPSIGDLNSVSAIHINLPGECHTSAIVEVIAGFLQDRHLALWEYCYQWFVICLYFHSLAINVLMKTFTSITDWQRFSFNWCVSAVSVDALEAERKEGNVLFNDALNTFYLRLYGVRQMVKYYTDSERATWATLSD